MNPKRWLFDGALIAAFAIVFELALRATAPEYGQKVFDREFTGSFPVERQREGYRGPKVSPDKPDGEYRVLALGDSVTFGTGVPAEATWPAALERLLVNRHASGKVRAINAGIEASSLADLKLGWEEQWRRYTPDVVVLGLTANAISLGVIEREAQTPKAKVAAQFEPPDALGWLKQTANRLAHVPYTPSFASIQMQRVLYFWGLLDHTVDPRYPAGPMLAFGWQQGQLPEGLSERAYQRLAEDLGVLDASIRTSGARLIVLWLPPRFVFHDSFRDNEKNIPFERFTLDPRKRLAEIAKREQLEYVDVTPVLATTRARLGGADLYIHFDYNHFDAEGHAATAQAALAALEPGRKSPEKAAAP